MKLPAFTKTGSKTDFGNPYLVVLNTVAIFLISQFIAVLLVEIGLALSHPHADVVDLLDKSIPGQLVFVLIAEVVAAGLVWVIVRHRGLPLASIGLGRKPKLADLWHAAGGFVGFYILLIFAGLVLQVFFPHINTSQKQDLGFNNITTNIDGAFAFIALVILPPLGEEPLVRGYLFGGLRSRLKFWPSAIITSILFGIAHLELGSGAPLVWAAGIDTFILSMVLVYLRDRTGALYAGILVHMLNNLVAFGVHFK